MGEEATAEQTPAETTPENVDALLEAARYDDIEDIVSLASSGVFLDSKDSQGRTALHMASANGHLGIVDYLITNGAVCGETLNVGFDAKLMLAGCQDVNAPNFENNTPLHWACLNGHVEVVKNLILAGASVSALNSHERTPMDEAVSMGKMDVLDAINAAVAQVELSDSRIS